MSQTSGIQAQNAGGGEFASLKTPPHKDVKPAPVVGSKAPSATKLPFPNGRVTILVFLRHCGCPFAEKTFKDLATVSAKHENIQCIAVSHSSEEATERWIPQVGGTWNVQVIVDEERDLYAQWGLGISNTWHAFSPSVLWSAYKLGTTEGIWNRPTESGNRWQTGGAFAIDRLGIVCWVHAPKTADDLPNFDEAVDKLSGK